ncbi:MAG: hypothetical protein ACRCV3_02370 [Desulfovibrionaceae bacterium]
MEKIGKIMLILFFLLLKKMRIQYLYVSRKKVLQWYLILFLVQNTIPIVNNKGIGHIFLVIEQHIEMRKDRVLLYRRSSIVRNL